MAVDAGYTNQFDGQVGDPASPNGTVDLYDIEAGNDVLTEQDPPNDGVLNTIGDLGVDVTEVGGYDILATKEKGGKGKKGKDAKSSGKGKGKGKGDPGNGFAALVPESGDGRSVLYQVNDDTGKATAIANIGSSGAPLETNALAIFPKGFNNTPLPN